MGGVVVLNLAYLAVGYAVLSPFLRQRSAASLITFGGLAALAGAGLIGVTLSIVAIAGLPANLWAAGLTAVGLAAIGLSARSRVSDAFARRLRYATPTLPDRSSAADGVVAAAACAMAAVCGVVLVAGFRSVPWLDDSWTFWLPKGVQLTMVGLDGRVFIPNSQYVFFGNLDYPLWWSLITGLDAAAVGRIDLRAMNAQIVVLYVAFVSAAVRLLWGRVRPRILLPGIFLIAVAPELTAQTQSGGADLPLAFYVALATLAAVVWILDHEPLALALTFIFAATAANTKDEGVLLLCVFFLVGGVFAWSQSRRNFAFLVGAVVAGLLTFLPWRMWTAAHGISGEVALHRALNPLHLWEQRSRFMPALEAVAHQLLAPRSWLVAVPLAVLPSLFLALRSRRASWLLPPGMLAAGVAAFIWIYWAGSVDLTWWLDTSAYRVVDSLAVTAGIAVPYICECCWRTLSPHRGRATVAAR